MPKANSADPDQTPPNAASVLGVCTVCLYPINGTLGIIG